MVISLFAVLLLAACGGGGGGGDPGPTSGGHEVVISGTVADLVPAAPRQAERRLFAPVDWSDASIEVLDAAGTVIGTATGQAGGGFRVSVSPGTNYFLRVTKGNLVLKAFLPDVRSDLTDADVNPESSAVVAVLGQLAGLSGLGDAGTDATGALAALELATVLPLITSDTSFTALGDAIALDIADHYDPLATEPTVGSAGTAGDTLALAIASTVNAADTTAPQNTTVANFIAGGVASSSATAVTLSLVATDDTGVSAYYASEGATPPNATAAGWSPVTGTADFAAEVLFDLSAGDGLKTVYVWFQDAAGNRSSVASDTINLNTTPANTAPVADAGLDQNITLGTGTVRLNGAGSSDGDEDPLNYSWVFTQTPAGSTATLSGAATVAVEFTPDLAGTYRVQLTVSDAIDTGTDVVAVVVTEPVGGLPTAHTGDDREIGAVSRVQLDGSLSSDPDGLALTYTWTQVATTCPDVTEGVGTLDGVDPVFAAPAEVCTLIFDLRVDNGVSVSSADRLTLYVLEQVGTGIFVDAANGDDANPGTRAAPKQSITAGLAAVWTTTDAWDVYVAEGRYPEYVSWTGGISLYGGFSAQWVRDPSTYVSAIEAEGTVIDCGFSRTCDGATLDGFTITSTSSAVLSAAEAILVSASHQSSSVRITNNTIVVHAAADGADSVASTAPNNPGWSGLPGNPGGDGGDGSCDGSTFGINGARGQGLHLGLDGGGGGAGGWTTGTNPQTGGTPGTDGTGTSWPDQIGGLGGVAGGTPGSSGSDGTPGSDGTDAADGAPAAQLGSFDSIGYARSSGETGGNGHAGAGGGGGGGGAVNTGLSNGNGGGGGGEGGEPGWGCRGASSGLGAFGIYIYGPTAATIQGNTITVGSGGSGGMGCAGGLGGAGGAGGSGGSLVCTDPIGAGGSGGAGGKGADGGAGGDGAGGPSIGVAYGSGATVNGDLDTSNTITVAAPAPGGPTNGMAGLSAMVNEF